LLSLGPLRAAWCDAPDPKSQKAIAEQVQLLRRWGGNRPSTGSAGPIKPIYTALNRAGIHDNSARRLASAQLRLADMDREGART
jgi:hypothetical protein